MGEKIIVGPINKGLRNDVTAFNVDNDSFPVLVNAYQWRGRIKRKRGTSLLTRLRRFFNSVNTSYGSTTSFNLVAGAGNILTAFSLQTNGNIFPGSVTLTDSNTANTYTDNSLGVLTGVPAGSGTINYATGDITISAGAGDTITTVSFNYYPDLSVEGLEDFVTTSTQFPTCIAFDTKYSYNIINADPFSSYDVSFYKNPTSGTYPGYIEKTNITPTTWNGADYQQFYTVNYQGVLWATNGINVPFQVTNIGMQYKAITGIVVNAVGPPALATLTIVAHGLVQGDFVFINEVVGTTGINFQTGYVVSANPQAANTVQVEFPDALLGGVYASGGIAQYLTNRSDTTKDCLRWYDGDPTDGNIPTPTLNGHKGWVNFAPPLSQGNYPISDLPSAKYYLVGARTIIPFKDRLIFLGPVVQTSAANSQVYLPDTIIYSQNGTPYYTASFQNITPAVDDPTLANIVFNPVLVPKMQLSASTDQTATAPAYFQDSTGFGGFIQAGIDQELMTVSINEDVLILGFVRTQMRFVYSGNDVVPFNFFVINSEFGSGSTFSAINMDKGVITTGSRGIIVTSQTNAGRIDLDIPDEVFQFKLTDNGIERITAQRDYINEWIYITYAVDDNTYKFPTQTLQYNYRDNSWAIFRESYTHYGLFRKQTGFTWQTVGNTFPTWSQWNEPWNAGSSNLKQPLVIAGNQQGFVLVRDDGTSEANSLYIRSIVGTLVTSPDHCLNNGDYIIISGAIGGVAFGVNGRVFSVQNATTNTFELNGGIHPVPISGTYLGGGLIKRMYVPLIQTKQFPTAWSMGRKTRIGVQQYLLTTTEDAQIQLLIFLSQNADSAYNNSPIIPQANVTNSSLLYSTVLYTCPESTNLGLTPANTNLQMPTAQQQEQIWHRINTSLIGDTVQLGFTLSDEQMRSLSVFEAATITGATQANPCVLTTVNSFDVGQLVLIEDVVGMSQLNGFVWIISAVSPTSITIQVNSTAFGAYVSGGTATKVSAVNQFAEIELHSILLDVNPSQMLC